MTEERILDITEAPAKLTIRHEQLVVQSRGRSTSVPLSEVAVLVVSHPGVSYSHAVLSGLCTSGGVMVLCDTVHMPAGMLLPLRGHYVQSERFRAQAEASKPLRKQLWRRLIQAKIRAQALVLKTLRGTDKGLSALAWKVRSGDSTNVEGQASRRYWQGLFGGEFVRSPSSLEQTNMFLNYGYAVLRAVVARAICAAGLHPSLGLHHHNRYNPFCLADDLMEPLRPLVDRTVATLLEQGPQSLTAFNKRLLLQGITQSRLLLQDQQRGPFDAATRMASSLARCFQSRTHTLLLVPQLTEP
jgi:CRISPR-associated protein Cas1